MYGIISHDDCAIVLQTAKQSCAMSDRYYFTAPAIMPFTRCL